MAMGGTPKGMVYHGKSENQMDDARGYCHFLETSKGKLEKHEKEKINIFKHAQCGAIPI
jgi:hypothetical protein